MARHPTPLDLAFHALSDPTRRAVIARLVQGEAPISTLAEPFDMALPSFAQHVRVLEDCGLIASDKRGRSRWCRLVPTRFDEVADWMEDQRRQSTERLDRLEAYLEKTQENEVTMANPDASSSPDLELVLVKVLKHPRDKVFAAWMDAEALAQWYGPAGFTIENHDADIREGGFWRFDMVGLFEGEERRFETLMRFVEIVPNERIVMDYGTPEPSDPNRFRMTVTFDEQADGKTVLTMRQRHPSRERRQAVMRFGAVEYGQQTLECLAAWLDR